MENKENNKGLLIAVWILALLLIVAMSYIIYDKVFKTDNDIANNQTSNEGDVGNSQTQNNTETEKEPKVNEKIFTYIGKTYLSLKSELGNIVSEEIDSPHGNKTRVVEYDNGIIIMFDVMDGVSKDNEISNSIQLKFENLFINYNDKMLEDSNMQEMFDNYRPSELGIAGYGRSWEYSLNNNKYRFTVWVAGEIDKYTKDDICQIWKYEI